MLKLKYAFLTASLGIFVSCGNVNKSDVQRNLDSKRDSGPIDSTNSISSKPQDTAYLKETSNAISAKSLAAVLQSYLKDDIKTLPAADRSFSFYEIDLNSDKQNEYLIKLPDK